MLKTINRYLFGATLGELWSVMRDERNHPTLTAMLGAPSLDALLDQLGRASLSLPGMYQQISVLLQQHA